MHVPEFLAERAQACGIDVKTIETYIDSFRYISLCFLLYSKLEFNQISKIQLGPTPTFFVTWMLSLQIWCPSARWIWSRFGAGGDAVLWFE